MPESLSRLPELARNLWWSWHPRARALFEALRESETEPLHHNPVEWLDALAPETLAARAIQTITPRFSARRMVKEYVERFYLPAWMGRGGLGSAE